MTRLSFAPPQRRKLRIRLPPIKPAPAPPPRTCPLCRRTLQAFAFPNDGDVGICNSCTFPGSRLRFSAGLNWLDTFGGSYDTGRMNEAMAVIRAIEREDGNG